MWNMHCGAINKSIDERCWRERLGVDRFQFRNVRRVGVSSIEGIKHADKFFIGGEWVSPSTSSKIDVINPATEEVFLTVAAAHEADNHRAVARSEERRVGKACGSSGRTRGA